jgi:Pentapeptide repeats (8 copies)
MTDTRFTGANAAGAHFGHCRVVRCDFRDVKLGAGSFENSRQEASAVIPAFEPDWIIGTDFSGADLSKASLWGCQLDDVTFGPGTWVASRSAEVAEAVLAELAAIPDEDRSLGDRMLQRAVEPYLRPTMSGGSSIVIPAGRWAALDLAEYEPTARGILRRAAVSAGVRLEEDDS